MPEPILVKLQSPLGLIVAGAVAFGGLACASKPTTARLPPQTMTPSAPPEQPAPVPVSSDETPTRETEPKQVAIDADGVTTEDDGLTVVISEELPPEVARRRTLVEAAAAERERRKNSISTPLVITDKNLHEWARGQLTESEVVSKPEEDPGADAGASTGANASDREGSAATEAPDVDSDDPEGYWRRRVLEARMNWRNSALEIDHLENRIEGLRTRFYEEDDPYYRDNQVKPSWDRAIDRLEEARDAAREFEREVATILDDGRRAGALPGWLREGLKLEPDLDLDETEGPEPPSEYVIGEPRIAKDPDNK